MSRIAVGRKRAPTKKATRMKYFVQKRPSLITCDTLFLQDMRISIMKKKTKRARDILSTIDLIEARGTRG